MLSFIRVKLQVFEEKSESCHRYPNARAAQIQCPDAVRATSTRRHKWTPDLSGLRGRVRSLRPFLSAVLRGRPTRRRKRKPFITLNINKKNKKTRCPRRRRPRPRP